MPDEKKWRHEPLPSYVLKNGILALVYFFAARFGLSLAFATAQVTTVWPPTGIALAALLLFGKRFWPGVFVGAFFANLLTDEPVAVALGIAIGNTLEAVVGAYFLRAFVGFRTTLDRVRDALGFVLFAAVFATMVSATVGVASLALGGLAEWANFGPVWFVWWVGDMMGALIVAPLLFAWCERQSLRVLLQKPLELTLLFILVIGVSVFVFQGPPVERLHVSLAYLVFPLLMWAALRGQQIGTATAAFLVSAVAVWGTVNGMGPFTAGLSVEENLIYLQVFMFVMGVAAILLSAAVAERTAAEDRFRGIFDASTDGIKFATLDGTLLDVNGAFTAFTGYSRGELVGKMKYQDITASEYHGIEAHAIEEVVRTGKAVVYEKEYVRKDGSRVPALVTVFVVRGATGEPIGLAAIARDITEQRRINRAKDELIMLVSHQFRTPLSIIKWCTEKLLQTGGKVKDHELALCLQDISGANQRMLNTVRDIMDISRIELGAFTVEARPVVLTDVAKEVIEQLRPQITAKDLSVKEKYGSGSPVVENDPSLIGIIFQNLLSNAVKFTSAKGAVGVDVGEYDNDSFVITVSDTGCGIPKDEQNRVFTRMFRGTNVREIDPEGTGLGLYLAKLVVGECGGRMWFESTEGKGTTFYVILPKKAPPAKKSTHENHSGN